jgi:peroxiredoxin
MPIRLLAAALALALAAASASAGEFNQVLTPGDAAPAWKDLPGADGKQHSLADLPADNFVLVVFTCNSCPIARDYEDRLIEFTRQHAEDVSVAAINVNNIPEDSLEKMKERAAERKFPYAYLFDESQQIAKDYGASGTPEFFLLSPATEGRRKILYMGAMDDSSKASNVKKRYLADALAAAQQGQQPEVRETFAHGCRIRFSRERRKAG